MSEYTLEVCVDSFESALVSINAGAKRLEVCSSLELGGLTPSNGLIMCIKNYLQQNFLQEKIKLSAMIRPRSGDFLYSQKEIDQMIYEITTLKEHVSGFVFGALTKDAKVDIKKCETLIQECNGREITFHRAFDGLLNPLESLQDVINLKFHRVLTSGAKNSVKEGIVLIQKLIDASKGKIIIVPGCGINSENLSLLKNSLNTIEFHASGRELHRSSMQYINKYIYDSDFIANSYDYKIANYNEINKMVNILNKN